MESNVASTVNQLTSRSYEFFIPKNLTEKTFFVFVSTSPVLSRFLFFPDIPPAPAPAPAPPQVLDENNLTLGKGKFDFGRWSCDLNSQI